MGKGACVNINAMQIIQRYSGREITALKGLLQQGLGLVLERRLGVSVQEIAIGFDIVLFLGVTERVRHLKRFHSVVILRLGI